jgi:hypothetical protein
MSPTPRSPGAGDLLGVAAHDDVNVVGAQGEGGKGLLDVARPVDRQVDPVRAVVLRSPPSGLLAGHRVRDDRQQLGRVVGQQPEMERLVAVSELLEAGLPGGAGRR